ncbi:unnamed protein product [marine sediment metagenome]|uniref:Uncharacterized protein n=1 Tax=marine sediment metagenome TaxID=412755 RepID=X1SEK7_9ZZZZ
MVKSPERWLDKQLARVRVAEGDFRAGVEAVTENPAAKALAANAKRIKKLQDSIANKTWEKRMAKVSLDDWKKKAAGIGADRFISGVEANVDKIENFIRAFQPKLESLTTSVKAMPDTTEAERDSRVLAMVRGLRKLKGTW